MWKTDYQITEGQDAVWKLGSSGTLRFRANGDIFYFRSIAIDGKTVPKDAYALSSGSTIVDLSAELLNKLAKGTHTIAFVYADGQTPAVSFTAYAVPKTGDSNQPALLCGLMAASILGLCLLTRRKRS